MRHVTRWSSAILLASLAAGACGGGSDTATTDSAAAAGEVAAGGTAGSMGAMGDSAAMGGAAAGGVDAAAISGLSEPDMMGLVGASNAAEIVTSRVAVEKATNADVKAFARRMVDEHQTMQGQADQLATRLNITPGTPDMATQKTQMANSMAEQLRGVANGEQFDRQYMDGQVQAHQRTLAELQAMQNTGNAELRTLIQNAIPKVQAHLQEAQQLQGRVGGGAAGTTGGAAGTGTTGGATGGATGGTTSGTTGGATGTGTRP
jgi:putative membrane protein